MANNYFRFKQFTVHQDRCAMKVTTDACLFGAWVSQQLSGNARMKLLDIGTGTGLLPLMLAQQCNNAVIDTIEIDEEAFSQATENVKDSRWADRISCLRGDIRTYDFPEKYNVVVSNPPFYENELSSPDTVKNIAHHGEGLRLGELIALIDKLLKPGGHFFLLLPYKRMKEVNDLLKGPGLHITTLCLVRPSVNHDHFRIMLRGTKRSEPAAEISFDEIAIKDDGNNYTKVFSDLLKEYYLYL